MRSFLAYLLVFSASVCGCATVPDLPDESRVHIPDVVDRIRCEFAEAIALQPSYKDWVSKFTLTLQIEAKSNLAGSTVLTFPIHYGTFKVSLESNLNRTTTRTASLDFTMIFNRAPSCPLPEERPSHLREFFRSKIGLHEWLERVSLSRIPLRVARDDEKPPTGAPEILAPSTIGYTLEFVILLDGKVNPSFSIMLPNGHGIDGSASVFRSGEYTHKLVIAMTPRDDLNAPHAAAPAKVCIVNKDAEKKLGPCPEPEDKALRKMNMFAKKEIREYYRDRLTPAEEQRLDNTLLQLRLQNLRIRP